MPGKVIPLRPSDHSITEEQAHAALGEREQQHREREAQGDHLSYRRQRSVRTFARIPHAEALALYQHHRLCGAAWTVLVELDYLILRAGGRNPVKFSSSRLRAIGLNRDVRARALRELEAAGVIAIRRRGRDLSP